MSMTPISTSGDGGGPVIVAHLPGDFMTTGDIADFTRSPCVSLNPD